MFKKKKILSKIDLNFLVKNTFGDFQRHPLTNNEVYKTKSLKRRVKDHGLTSHCFYKPINMKYAFSPEMIDIKDLLKERNFYLIKNQNLKKIIIDFNNETKRKRRVREMRSAYGSKRKIIEEEGDKQDSNGKIQSNNEEQFYETIGSVGGFNQYNNRITDNIENSSLKQNILQFELKNQGSKKLISNYLNTNNVNNIKRPLTGTGFRSSLKVNAGDKNILLRKGINKSLFSSSSQKNLKNRGQLSDYQIASAITSNQNKPRVNSSFGGKSLSKRHVKKMSGLGFVPELTTENSAVNNELMGQKGQRKSMFLTKNLKIRGAESHSVKGRIDPLKITKSHYTKPNQDCSFSKVNFLSKKLGEISLFGVFDGNGRFGTHIAAMLKNFMIEHFTNCKNMKVNSMVDNFYGIMSEAFVRGQEFLVKNEAEKGYNLDFSGATGCVLLYPNNNTNKIYCANVGRGRCVVYSISGTYKMSYDLEPERPSEKERMEEFVKSLTLSQSDYLTSQIIAKQKELQNDYSLHYHSSHKPLVSQFDYHSLNIPETQLDFFFLRKFYPSRLSKKFFFFPQTREEREKEAHLRSVYLRTFETLNVSRCFGNLAAGSSGVICEPEVVECDLKMARAKFAVLGTAALWKFMDETEVGAIVRKYETLGNGFMACRELENVARMRWKNNCRKIDDISVIVVFFEQKI